MHIINNLYWHKRRIGKEMMLTVQIGEYNKYQVILYLGYDVNVLPN